MGKDFQYLLLTLGISALPVFFFSSKNETIKQISLQTSDPNIEHFRHHLEAPENPEVVFFGTSKTMNNLSANLLCHDWKIEKRDRKALNLGINWFGYDMQSTLIHQWLSKKSPELLVLEVDFIYKFDEHPNYKKCALPSDIRQDLMEHPLSSIDTLLSWPYIKLHQYFSKSTSHIQFKDPLNRLHIKGDLIVPLTKKELKTNYKTSEASLQQGLHNIPKHSALKETYYQLRFSYQKHHLKRIKQICEDHQVQLVLLALPRIRINNIDPSLKKVYEDIAPIITPPSDLTQKPEIWRDSSHFNLEGALRLTPWLKKQLNQWLK